VLVYACASLSENRISQFERLGLYDICNSRIIAYSRIYSDSNPSILIGIMKRSDVRSDARLYSTRQPSNDYNKNYIKVLAIVLLRAALILLPQMIDTMMSDLVGHFGTGVGLDETRRELLCFARYANENTILRFSWHSPHVKQYNDQSSSYYYDQATRNAYQGNSKRGEYMMRSKTDTINGCDIDSVVIALSINRADLDRKSTTDTYLPVQICPDSITGYAMNSLVIPGGHK
jgi:hypothetical protein